MAYVIKKCGSGLMQQIGSSFGGITAAAPEPDTYLAANGGWVQVIPEARKFLVRQEAETHLGTLPNSKFEIVED